MLHQLIVAQTEGSCTERAALGSGVVSPDDIHLIHHLLKLINIMTDLLSVRDARSGVHIVDCY